MSNFARLFSSLVSKFTSKFSGKLKQWRAGRSAKRHEAPQAPAGYNEPAKPARTLDLPEITTADFDYNREQLHYDELREYRDQLTELLTSFDFPPDIVEALSNIDLDTLEGADFTRLNGAIERLERYRLAFEGGYITADDFDYDYIVNELNSSIPGLDLQMPSHFNLNPYLDIFSDAAGIKSNKMVEKFIGGLGI